MAMNPDATFEAAVLELIEHSPIGAVPRTPTHHDALQRLLTSRQVYPDADHRDGYVTARSLAARPCFYAANLDALIAGAIEVTALEPDTSIFDRYVGSLPAALRPKAEVTRLKIAGRTAHHRVHAGVIAHDPVHTLFLVPGTGRATGIAGNYLYGSLRQLDADAATSRWAVHLHDSDDGAVTFETATLAIAIGKLQEVIASAPFHLSELEGLGFRSN